MADAYGINWGAIEQPNILGSYLQGQQFKQQQADNALSRRSDAEDRQMRRDEFGLRKEQAQQQIDQRTAQQRGEAALRVASGLKGVPAGQRMQALKSALPMLQATGLDPSVFANLSEDQLTDAALDTFTGEVASQMKFFSTSSGVVGVDPRGESRLVYEDPLAQNYKRAQINATNARAGASTASADASRARAARGGASGGGSPSAPASGGGSKPWERKW